ncbi:MAG: 50S ribosomal protein L25 [Chitinivibrionales bacterium]|nr:50S ribosomal protein L25 [Chitinivibrionales bacterium]MBD3397145.1 50S ribosomal protein L25 [Chitinivibrionales bacterium]
MRRFESFRPSNERDRKTAKQDRINGGFALEIIKLKSRPRSGRGKSYNRKARQQGWIPANYYGRNIDAQNIEVNCKEFGAILRAGKGTHLIDLGLSDAEVDSVAIIKEIQRDVLLPGHIEHIDFQHTAMNEEVTVECPIEIVGHPVGVLEEEGVLNHPVQRLTIHCQARYIPEKITVDVSGLHIGESIHVKDLAVENVTFRNSPDEVIASVTHAAKIEEPVVEAAEEGAEGEAVEGEAAGEGAAAAEGDKAEGEKKEKGGEEGA